MSSAALDRKVASAGAVIPSISLSTIGAKAAVAVTGLFLVLFLIAHLVGNLLIFKGPDAINAYAKFLKDQGPLLWVARIGLLSIFVVHVALAILLSIRKKQARPQRYVFERTIQATLASRYMLMTGLVVLLFVVFHVSHYTLGLVGDAGGKNYLDLKTKLNGESVHDVYTMVKAGFANPVYSMVYILCQVVLAFHLFHGGSSLMQTLGINHVRYNKAISRAGLGLGLLIAGGNIAIVLSVWFGIV